MAFQREWFCCSLPTPPFRKKGGLTRGLVSSAWSVLRELPTPLHNTLCSPAKSKTLRKISQVKWLPVHSMWWQPKHWIQASCLPNHPRVESFWIPFQKRLGVNWGKGTFLGYIPTVCVALSSCSGKGMCVCVCVFVCVCVCTHMECMWERNEGLICVCVCVFVCVQYVWLYVCMPAHVCVCVCVFVCVCVCVMCVCVCVWLYMCMHRHVRCVCVRARTLVFVYLFQ